MSGRRYVIIGDGAAGMSCAREVRHRDPAASIAMISDDPQPAYYRAALTNYLLGELREEQLWSVPPAFFSEQRIERRLSRVTRVTPERSDIQLSSGETLGFDRLLVASGARARQPAFEGAQLPGVLTLRTFQDARAIMDRVLIGGARHGAVIGGGPLAIELACALVERKLRVVLLVREAAILAGALDAVGSDLVIARLREVGIDVRLRTEVREARAGRDGSVAQVTTSAGETIAAEIVGAGIGVVANTDLLAGSGIKLRESGAVAVDDALRTSRDHVFAAGDVAEPPGARHMLWEPAQLMGRVAARNMTGATERYAPGAQYFATRLGDLDFASVGTIDEGAADDVIVDRTAGTGAIAYRKVLLRQGRVVGALMLGHRSERVRARGRAYKSLCDEGIDVRRVRDHILDPTFDLRAFIEQATLLDARAAPAAKPVEASSLLRGTQVLRIDLPAPKVAVRPAADQRMLSIGFRAPVAAATDLEPAGFLQGAHRWPLSQSTVSIGRHAQCDIVLDDPEVAHKHALITRHGRKLYLRDAGSRSGTWVNGSLVTLPHALAHGDRLRVGGTELGFQAADAPSRAPVVVAPAPASQGKARLEGCAGPCLGVAFALNGPQVTVGRDPASAVRLDDISVSRRHALLSEHQGGWHVCDLHSSRGTMRNGKALPPGQDTPLEAGDELRMGDSVMRFTVR